MSNIRILETTYQWGKAFEFKNKNLTEIISGIRLLNITPQRDVSLKIDSENTKLWHIALGSGKIRVGNEVHLFKKNDKFLIKKNTLHQIKSEGKTAILELIYQ